MRAPVSALIGALGLAAVAVSAQGAPIAPTTSSQMNHSIIQVAGGCGWGFHPTPWGDCVPNRYGYYRPYYWHPPYWGGYGYGGAYPRRGHLYSDGN